MLTKEFKEIEDRVLRPSRPHLKEVLSIVLGETVGEGAAALNASLREVGQRGITDPREAWEAIASREFLPTDAIDASQRRFTGTATCSVCGPEQRKKPRFDDAFCAECGTTGLQLLPHPNTVLEAVAFASDWKAVVTAEERATQYAVYIGKQQPLVLAWETMDEETARLMHKNWPQTRSSWSEPLKSALVSLDATGYLIARIRNGGVLMFAPPMGWEP